MKAPKNTRRRNNFNPNNKSRMALIGFWVLKKLETTLLKCQIMRYQSLDLLECTSSKHRYIVYYSQEYIMMTPIRNNLSLFSSKMLMRGLSLKAGQHILIKLFSPKLFKEEIVTFSGQNKTSAFSIVVKIKVNFRLLDTSLTRQCRKFYLKLNRSNFALRIHWT